MKGPIHYTAKDIERYHNGTMLPAERHALERAALDDPFLSDALEGYAFTQTPAQDMAALQQKLALRIQKDDRKKVFLMQQPWMKIAAIFILLAVGTWIILQTNSRQQQENIARSEKATAPAQTQEVNSFQRDTTAIVSDAPATDETVMLQKNRAAAPVQQIDDVKKDGAEKEALSPPPGSFYNFDTNRPVVTAATQQATEFKLKEQQDSSTFLQGKVNGVAITTRPNDTLKNLDVVMRDNHAELNEVVVSGYGTQKKTTNASAMRLKMKADTLQPEEGWDEFDEYITRNMKSPDELQITPVNGEVELRFDISKEGKPVNIAVTKSLCTKCDEEAVRLLKEGPKWKKAPKKGKVKIKF